MIETIRPGASAPGARAALLDFDGTLSLIRSGWLDIMLDMMVGTLSALGTGETPAELRAAALDFAWRNTGKDTIYQMIDFADAIRTRGGRPEDPHFYKQQFLDTLLEVSSQRTAELRNHRCPPDRYLVPGARALLEDLRARGLTLYLASGTDHDRLMYEAGLLDITRYFDGGIYGALPDPGAFSKRTLAARIPGPIIGFGDGPDETEAVRAAGGVFVGLATDEPECHAIDPFKRRGLIDCGADFIIPNYLCRQSLLPILFADHEPL
ncbi:MAG TPA: HAD family hydrolase [Candidatus Acidoferrales bacterium]|nr:HAD family hydrolase [Candidatus Acidoferrales bacterium]